MPAFILRPPMPSNTFRGADTPDNNSHGRAGHRAIQEGAEPIPKNINSVKGIAYLYLQMKKFDDAKKYYRRLRNSIPTIPRPTTRSP